MNMQNSKPHVVMITVNLSTNVHRAVTTLLISSIIQKGTDLSEESTNINEYEAHQCTKILSLAYNEKVTSLFVLQDHSLLVKLLLEIEKDWLEKTTLFRPNERPIAHNLYV